MPGSAACNTLPTIQYIASAPLGNILIGRKISVYPKSTLSLGLKKLGKKKKKGVPLSTKTTGKG